MSGGKKLKVAIVGASIAHSPDGRENFSIRAHIPALKALPDKFEIVAVCTTKMSSASESARTFGVPHAFDNVHAMLAQVPEIDIVCVSVRPRAHYEVVMAALEAGKHVYCEHPMGTATEEAREMFELARAKGVRTCIGHQLHFHPASRHMMRLVAEGFVGKPLSFNYGFFWSNYIIPRPSHRQWLFQSSVGGHAAYRSDKALERTLSLLGRDILEVSTDMAVKVPERQAIDTGGVLKSDQMDTISYLARLADGLSGMIHVSYAAWYGTGERMEIYGTEGMLMLTSVATTEQWQKATSDGDPNRGGLKLYGKRVDMKQFLADPIPAERLQRAFEEIVPPEQPATNIHEGRASYYVAEAWAAFHEAIVTGAPFAPSFTEGLKIHSILDAAERSLASRSWAPVDYSWLSAPASQAEPAREGTRA